MTSDYSSRSPPNELRVKITRYQLDRHPRHHRHLLCPHTRSHYILHHAQYSASQAILLWDGEDLNYALTHQKMREGLIRKYRRCVERAIPRYNLSLGESS
jgi:hypothetical protein